MTARDFLSGRADALAEDDLRRLGLRRPARRDGPDERHLRRRAARARGAGGAAPCLRALHRARGRHRGRVPPAAPRAGRPGGCLDRGHRRGRRELHARARRPRRDRRLRGARRRRPATCQARPGDLPRQGQGRRAARHRHRRGGRHRHLRHRAGSQPATRPRGRRQGQGHRPHRADPRHLRAARQEPGGQGPGRAGPAPVPPPAPARLGRVDVASGRWPGRRRSGHGLARPG